jgi:uncharacterized protein
MSKKIFINLPVEDLKKSMDFYSKIGFTNNPTFTDETGACMVLTDEIFVMLLTHDKFAQFTSKKIINPKNSVGVINALSVDTPEEVSQMVDAAVKAGGIEPVSAKDYGFMIQRTFDDPDGNVWEVVYMDMSKVPG